MDSGTSGGSMQSGSSGEDDQNDTSFSPSPLSIPSLNHHHQNLQAPAQAQAHTHLHQQPLFSSQHLHLYPSLTNTTRDNHHMINPYQHQPVSSHNSFLETLPQSDLDRIWSMGLNSHPQSHHQQHHQQQQQHDNQQQQMFYSASSSSAMNNLSQQDPQQKFQPTGKSSTTTQPGKENGSLSTGRVVKKRTRASRKTPTTVLTTDTTNFRAMVQEFTGIPTPPFGPSPLFPTKKFDLFNPNNNSLDPSLGSLLYSLNKANNNNSNNPNPNTFAPPPPPPLITTTASLSTNPNPYHHQQQSQSQSQQMMMMMMPSGSNSNLLYVNLPQGHQNQNPNLAFQQSSLRQSKYSGNEQVEVDHQLQAGYSKGENDNFSGTG